MNKKQLCGWLMASLVLPGCATVDLQKPTTVSAASMVTPLVEKIENLTATG